MFVNDEGLYNLHKEFDSLKKRVSAVEDEQDKSTTLILEIVKELQKSIEDLQNCTQYPPVYFKERPITEIEEVDRSLMYQ